MSEKINRLPERSAKRLRLAISSTVVGLMILSTNEIFFENGFAQIVAIICFIFAIVIAFIDLSKNKFNSFLHHLIFGVAASLFAISIQIGIVWSFAPAQGTFLYNLFQFGLGSYLLVTLIAAFVSIGISSILAKGNYQNNLWLTVVTILVSFTISFVGFSYLSSW